MEVMKLDLGETAVATVRLEQDDNHRFRAKLTTKRDISLATPPTVRYFTEVETLNEAIAQFIRSYAGRDGPATDS